MLNVITHDWGGLVYAGGVAGRCETAPVGGSGGRDELRRDGEWLAAQGQQDRLEGPDPAPSRRFDHRAHLGMEPGAPDRAEAVGDLAEDRTPAQRLLRAIVDWGSLGLEEEDEQLVLPPEQAAAELLGGHVACDWLRDHLRECEEVAPEEGLDHPGAAAACQALAMTPDANSATQQRNHLPGQHGVAAVERVLGVAQEVGKAGLVLLPPAPLRPEPVGDPNTWPHAAQEALDHVLVAPWFDDEAATVGILEHPKTPKDNTPPPPKTPPPAPRPPPPPPPRPPQPSAANRRHLPRERRRRSLEHRRQRALAQLHPELHVQNRGQPLIGHGVTLPQIHHRRRKFSPT